MQKIYSVIHASDTEQIYRNVARTILAGADGAFLIDHAGIDFAKMVQTRTVLTKCYPGFFIGINPLSINSPFAFEVAQIYEFDGLWLDESYIRVGDKFDDELLLMDEYRKSYKGLYFGSVAFKTQGTCSDPNAVAVKAIDHVDVVTTSGPGTAMAPDVAKIAGMKLAIGSKPLAIASGMSPENIHLFHMADAILVASGVQDNWTELNVDKLRLMVERKAK